MTLRDRLSSTELYRRLGVESVAVVVRRGRLRWFGHLERNYSTDWTSSCRSINIYGRRNRSRSMKTWDECVRQDVKSLGLKKEWALERTIDFLSLFVSLFPCFYLILLLHILTRC